MFGNNIGVEQPDLVPRRLRGDAGLGAALQSLLYHRAWRVFCVALIYLFVELHVAGSAGPGHDAESRDGRRLGVNTRRIDGYTFALAPAWRASPATL